MCLRLVRVLQTLNVIKGHYNCSDIFMGLYHRHINTCYYTYTHAQNHTLVYVRGAVAHKIYNRSYSVKILKHKGIEMRRKWKSPNLLVIFKLKA